MSGRLFFSLTLIAFLVTLSACSLLAPDQPLPTLVPTAEPIPPQGNLGRVNTAVATTVVELPTQAIPTASPTSLPTTIGAVTAEDFVSAATLVSAERVLSTAETALPSAVETAVPVPASQTPTPTLVPTNTPTAVPSPTSTPTPVLFPRLPDVIWPSPEPYNFPVANSPRHGVGFGLGGHAEGTYGPAPYSWTYTWTPVVPPVSNSIQHVSMLAGRTTSALPPVDVVKLWDSYNDHNYWLVFNECEHQGQCDASPAEAAQFFHDRIVDLLFIQGGDPDADIIIGGVNAHPCGILWLKNFVDYYRVTYGELPVAGWHFHLYPEIAPHTWPNSCDGDWAYFDFAFQNPVTAFELWVEHANNAADFVREYGKPDDEIWFTEMGCLNYGFHQIQAPACQAEGFMQAYATRIVNWLNTDGRWVTRYAWFTSKDDKYWRATHLIWEAPVGEQWTYSSLGYWYANVVPSAAVPLEGFQ